MNPLLRLLPALFALPVFAWANLQLGQAAPEFSLSDTAGKAVKLSDFKGKHVVLEWTNPHCPFVRKHYDSQNMQGLQKEFAAKGVVWLAINSTGLRHNEYLGASAMDAKMKAWDAKPAATLLDGTSQTARLYGAKTTPHMYIVNPAGTLVFAGGIDDKRSSNPEDVKTSKNFVRAALDESLVGKAVSVASATPYGCSIKY